MPFLNMTLNNLNANHSYRLVLIDGSTEMRWLMRLRFSNKDKSIYFSPLLEEKFKILFPNNDADDIVSEVSGDYHLSIHESRVINFTSPDNKIRLRHDIRPDEHIEKITTLGISNISKLPICTDDEFNKPKGGQQYLPVVGATQIAPIFVTFFCINTDVEWENPIFGNTFSIGYKLIFPKKGYQFYMVVWQDTRIQKINGDIGFQWHE